uniref:NADH-ubiquinone oxidoreductase chain 3 n=1 Tax=Histeroidea sp. 1 KM-2017 TaxID=2219434 RepID=A0A346RGT8_9COLE|nr:NADH dehydrogenase subunit 3 [Histeroidea sp. 1 KM-2017]
MKILITSLTIIMMIVLLMMGIAAMLSKKTWMDREKASPFECGFDPSNSPRIPFSLQFFLVGVLFLVFDVEITLLIPIIQTMKISKMINYTFIMLLFILILLAGLYHEWNQGALQWTN